MLTNKQIKGNFGEDYTVKYLKKNGYKIIERNFHSKFGEIDVIATKKDIIAFVEVKTRKKSAIASPREAVDIFKQRKCIKTAEYFMVVSNCKLQPRFDVSEIVTEDKNFKISVVSFNYIENAFGV